MIPITRFRLSSTARGYTRRFNQRITWARHFVHATIRRRLTESVVDGKRGPQ